MNASWIAAPGNGSPALAKTFRIPDGAAGRAVLRIAAPGFYEAWLDGRRVGDAVLDPAPTDYTKRVYFREHPLDLAPGDHELRVLLGHGWLFRLAFDGVGATPRTPREEVRPPALSTVGTALRARRAWLEAQPARPTPGFDGLWAKCLAVEKVNTLSPEGAFSCRWTTPTADSASAATASRTRPANCAAASWPP